MPVYQGKITEKGRIFAESYCNEAKGSVGKAYEACTDITPKWKKLKKEGSKKYDSYISRQGYAMLNRKSTQGAIAEIKERKNRDFWLTESDILRGIHKEATDYSPKSSQTARIQAWVWLGKHISMFHDKGGGGGKALAEGGGDTHTYNIINYHKPVDTPPPVEKVINPEPEPTTTTPSSPTTSTDDSNLFKIKDYS